MIEKVKYDLYTSKRMNYLDWIIFKYDLYQIVNKWMIWIILKHDFKMKKKEWFRLCAWMMISNQKNDTKRMNDIVFTSNVWLTWGKE